MSVLSASLIGIEDFMDEVEEVVMDNINDSLAFVYEARKTKDQERAQKRNVVYNDLKYDEVPRDHIYVGWVPSFTKEEVPKESYPYIALTWEDYLPDPEDAMQDMRNVYRQALTIHALVIATDAEGPDISWRRAVRMAEAVYFTLANSASMQSKLRGFSNPVRAQPSIPFTSKFQGHGDQYWFQAVGTSYQVKHYTSQYD